MKTSSLLSPLTHLGVSLLALFQMDSSQPAWAGSGRVNDDGTIDFTVNLRYVPTEDNLTVLREAIIDASHRMWDATEGQLRFGVVTLTTGAVNEDLADIWVYPHVGRSLAASDKLGTPGKHITLFQDDVLGGKIAHEMGHLALNLGDEYPENPRFNNCWGIGACMEAGTTDDQNQCIMQSPLNWTELCVASNHDPVLGDGRSCEEEAVPNGCEENCEYFNHDTGNYETSAQTARHGKSCWESLVEKFPFLTAPADLPVAVEPADFVEPVFEENYDLSDTVMLILDRSGSMRLHPNDDDGEVCGDGVDNDGNGEIDERGCKEARLEFVKAAARAWLALASNQGIRVGMVSFNEEASLLQGFEELTGANIGDFTQDVDDLTAGGETAIGEALLQTIFTFDAEEGALNKTAFLISDGRNTDGPEPESVTDELQAHDIRVFAISTGEASNDDTLANISGESNGALVDSRDASTLVNAFAQQFANYRNITTLIPRRPFVAGGPTQQAIPLSIEPGQHKTGLIAAGNLSDMSGFGARILLRGPEGAAPRFYDSDAAHPNLRVIYDRYFTLIEALNLSPGQWEVRIVPRAGAAPIQTGHLTVLNDNPHCELFTSVDRRVVRDTRQPVRLDIEPIHHTTLRKIDSLTAQLKQPDGTVVPLNLLSDELSGRGEYHALIDDMPMPGLYEVQIAMETGENTFNDPGESIFSDSPPNSVQVPDLVREAVQYFFVPGPQGPAPNDDPGHATVLKSKDKSSIVEGRIGPGNLLDYFQFDSLANAKTWITVDTGGPFPPANLTRDSIVTLLRPNGITALETDHDDGSGNGADRTLESDRASAIAGRALPQAGKHFIRVRANAFNEEVMPYRMYVTLTDQPATPEKENNNTRATANPIVTTLNPKGVRAGAIKSADDGDYYSVVGSNDAVLHISADGDPERDGVGTDLIVELLDSNGIVLFAANSSGTGGFGNPPAEGFGFSIESRQTFYVRIKARKSGGTYQLMVCRMSAQTQAQESIAVGSAQKP